MTPTGLFYRVLAEAAPGDGTNPPATTGGGGGGGGGGFDNPFADLFPDFTLFGTEFTNWWQKLFMALWALLILGAGGYLLYSFLAMRKATNNNIPGQADEAKSHAIWAAASVGCLAAFGVIMGAILAVAGT